jgi:hypothetical protein
MPDRSPDFNSNQGILRAVMSRRLFAYTALAIVLMAPRAPAGEVRLPLTVEPPVIRAALLRDLYNGANQRAVFWGEPGECSFFYLQDPEVGVEIGRVRVISRGEARLGTDLGATCLSPLAWGGFIELFARPRLDGWLLRFEIVDSNLLDMNKEKALLTGQLWDRIKESVQPRFDTVTIDLGGPFRDLREFLGAVVAPAHAEEARRAIGSLRPVAVSATPKGIVVEAALDVAETTSAPAPEASEPPLNEAEIRAFTDRANQWDAFVTFVIKTLGARALKAETRQALLETLIDARYHVADALAAPSRRQDPVRTLFLKSWERLRPVADEIARELPGAEAAQLVTFLAAGDALAVLDQAGPAFGIEVSADGLRRMARMIAPTATGDPLEYSPDLDPVLRRLLGFGAPLSSSDLPEAEPLARSEMPASGWGRYLGLGMAWAAEDVDRLRNWAGWVLDDRAQVTAYLQRVENLLARIAGAVAARGKLAAARSDLFRRLVPATAWQESCWRQFHTENGKVTYLRSSRGSVGMLQVNERVWRGFYEIEKLRWNVAYNVGAGCDVLLHYLAMVEKQGGESNVASAPVTARATYAGYNGGPAELRRYLDGKGRGEGVGRLVDQMFGPKFDAIGDDARSQIASCLVGGPA